MNNIIISILLIITIAVPLFFDGHLYSVFDLSKITVLYILTFLLVGVWAVRGFTWRWADTKMALPILTVLLATIISTALSMSPFISLVGTYKRYGGLISLMVFMVLFFAVAEFVKIEKIRLFMYAVILTACVASVYCIVQYYEIDPFRWTTNFGSGIRTASTFGHPSFSGAFLVMALPLVIYFILQRKWWFYPVGGLLIFALFLSKTRSAYIGMIVAVIYFFALYRKRISYKLIAVLFSSIIALSIFLPFSPAKRLADDLKGWKPSGTVEHRLRIWGTVMEIVKDNPIVGIGPDCLALAYPTYYELRYKEKCRHVTNRAHNAILEILATQGIIGLLAWLYIIVIYFWMVYQHRKDLLVVALSSAVVSYMVQNLATFGGAGITPLFWTLLGLTVIACRRDNVIV